MKIKTPLHNRIKPAILVLGVVLFACGGMLQSCSVEKFIPEGELLYDGATLEVTSDTTITNEAGLQTQLKSVLSPQPNGKILGMRPGLYFYYKAQREKPGFINKFLDKKIGKEPVYLSDVQTSEMEKLILNRLENNGFFYSVATSDVTEDEEDKTAFVNYRVDVQKPYEINTYQLDSDSLLVYEEIKKDLNNSVLKKGMRFNLNAMKAERNRVDNYLKNKGYYNFNPGFLIFEADTNQYDSRKLDMFLKLKKDVPKKSTLPYEIERVNIYPNYDIDTDSIKKDSTRYAEKNFFQNELFFKPKRLDPFLLLEEGQLYDPETSKNTSRRLSSIGTYKFINIQYNELPTENDSLEKLEANIYLSPLAKRALTAELQAVTKSNGFAGPTLTGTFTNRNLFKGGETLNLSAKVGYEVQTGGGSNAVAGNSTLLLGLNADLIFPRLIAPIQFDKNTFEYSIPKTKTSLGVDYLNRSGLYSLLSGTATFGYLWQANRYVNHEINPISINYVNLLNSTPEFQDILDENEFLENSFDQQFISGLTYSFTYNGMVDTENTHQFYSNINFDTAGNSLGLLTGSSGSDEPKEILNLQFAQYVKIDGDFRYHFNFGKDQKIATRLFAGIGIPYGNSEVLPYTKQYFSGGPYSVRAFQIRSLGPGTYTPDDEEDNSSFFDQTGNIRLEANIEYRFPIFGIVKGAFFADAGNIWNTENNESLGSNNKFTSDWINELGIGVGTGVRVDIQNFVIRFDLAAPVHDPQLKEGERWDFNVSEPVFNFAIGYPF